MGTRYGHAARWRQVRTYHSGRATLIAMSDLIAVDVGAGVGTIRMQRTDKHNAFNRELSEAVVRALDALEADASVV
jgi:hypothetical protein